MMDQSPIPPSVRRQIEAQHGADLDDRITAYRATPEHRAYRQTFVAEALGHTIAACMDEDRGATVAVLAAALEDLGAGYPAVPLLQDRIRDDAAFWATCASPPELEAYAAAALHQISKTAFALIARKRLLVWLWTGLPPTEKAAFLDRVTKPGMR